MCFISVERKERDIMNVSFSSTYRVPITQPGVNNAKKDKLRTLTQQYGGLISSSKTGAARVSLPNELDDKFEKDLKGIGYKQYQKFDAENLQKEKIDEYIKKALSKFDYSQKGKQKAGKPKEKELYN